MKFQMRVVLFILVLCAGMAMTGYSQTVYSTGITNIDGGSVALSAWQGKKIVFMIAPARLSDSGKIDQIVAFNTKYGDSVKLVGVMSIEDGYADSNKAAIKSMYQSKGANIVLTSGMYTKKAAANQGAIIKWLTTRTMNKRFEADAEGTGQKFFVDESGKLYSLLIPEVPLMSSAVERNIDRKL